MRRAFPVPAVVAAIVCISVAWPGGTAQATQSLGHATAIQAPVGAAADPNALLNAIACPAAGECVAVGQYVDGKGIKQAKRSARFSFGAQAATGFQCELIAPAKTAHKQPKPKFGACASSKSYTHLKAGKYTFLVRGVNAAGVDPTPARKTFTIG